MRSSSEIESFQNGVSVVKDEQVRTIQLSLSDDAIKRAIRECLRQYVKDWQHASDIQVDIEVSEYSREVSARVVGTWTQK
ncbi:hypothetical protein AU106_gp203 [Sinorhizobium phage phiM9]|uniref:Uncharacterized protein n=1 Tax=Sinorhizobium phage phiM9 TaxID=1636182 RepID=A0A0F6THA2_9CAUD|nr:hypothetical protein AU106_gp203 [Sinorhizobium phage phiM9]AKE44834.1 hypothetical protein Sm_phiM9_207 [Sinorhizobium phage phiM9]